MKPKHTPKAPGFFSVFLMTVMVTVEVLTLALFWLLQLSVPVLLIIGSVMVMADTVIFRMVFSKNPSLLRLRRLTATLSSLLVTAVSLAGCVTVVMLSSTVNAMFGSSDLTGSTPVTTPETPDTQPFAVYLSGSDSRGSTLTKSRSDVNIIAVADPVGRQLLLVNTPRDYYVANPAGSGAGDKLAHCGLYGTDNSRQALVNLYGVPIAYAAQINFKGFETLIDALGGVTIVSDTAFTTTMGGYRIQKGENTLSGAQALAFARERSRVSGGDVTRGKNQMKLIAALMAQVSPATLITNYREILGSLEGMFVTDMPLGTITRLMTTCLTDLNEWQVFSLSVTGTDGTDYNYSSGCSAYVMYPDADSVRHAADLMQRVLRGEAISQEDVANAPS